MPIVDRQSLPTPPTVAVWHWSLLAGPGVQADLWGLLSFDERARAGRFHFPCDRRRYVVARGTLRTRLAAYLGCRASAVAFSYGAHGKPALRPPGQGARLSFNLSHSDELAVLAVAGGAPVGVDVERARPVAEDFAAHAFAAEELAALRTLPARCRQAGVFACWTRREAYVKATGTGLSQPKDSFAVAVDPSRPARLLRTDADPDGIAYWTLTDLRLQPGYAAALAVRQQGCTVEWNTAATPVS